jgi:AmmeMemoRadiSam system protein B
MPTRKPAFAGPWYPGQHDSCVYQINQYLEEITPIDELPKMIVAGIAPHAGWTFSGQLAASVFSAIKQQNEEVHSFVVFGAHYLHPLPAAYDRGSWITPLGEIAIDEELAKQVLTQSPTVSDPEAHIRDNSIELQVPFIQYLFGGAKILPILVPPTEKALILGACVGEIMSRTDKKILCIGSTDLTHYGPTYGFTPMGTGAEAIKWAKEVNDRKFIDLTLALEPEGMLVEAAKNCNACGAGAAAAAVAAAKKLGKTEGLLLAQTNSNEVMRRETGTSSADSVGYAAIVF